MSDALPVRLTDVAGEVAGLRRAVAEMRAQWPTDSEFTGSDATSAVHVTVSPDGDVTDVRLEDDWTQRLEPRELARAVNQAAGAASASLAVTWIQGAHPDTIDLSAEPAPAPQVSLDSYRSQFPAPTTLDDLDAKFALAAAARAEYRRFRDEQQQLTRHDRFASPGGLFDVIRSRTSLLALETDRNRLALHDAGEIARDILAALDAIRLRAADDDARLAESLPAIAQVRERTAARLAALTGSQGEGARA